MNTPTETLAKLVRLIEEERHAIFMSTCPVERDFSKWVEVRHWKRACWQQMVSVPEQLIQMLKALGLPRMQAFNPATCFARA